MLVALLTDFGLRDPYVAQMKGAILSRCPGARVVDICHEVEPFNLAEAGFFLAATRPHFPAGTVFLCVVDPGVGGARRLALLAKAGQLFLAPDNGLLSLVLHEPGEARAHDATAWREPGAPEASPTFQGRDILAPLAARLAEGLDPAAALPEIPVDSLERRPWSEPAYADCANLTAHVLHVDRFGNCLLNLRSEAWSPIFAEWPHIAAVLPGVLPVRLARCYADLHRGELGLLAGSQGFLELSLREASAARELGLRSGHSLVFSCSPGLRPAPAETT